MKWSHYWGALTKWNNNAAGSRMSLESAALPEGPCEFVSPGEISLQIRPQTLLGAFLVRFQEIGMSRNQAERFIAGMLDEYRY